MEQESPEIYAHIHGQVIFDRDTKASQRRKSNLPQKWSGTTEESIGKENNNNNNKLTPPANIKHN